MSSVIITMLTGPHAGRSAKFEQGPVTYGRSPENMVVLATDAASRQHGQLEFKGNKWVVVNHSKNLTTLNGRKVKTEKALKSGDQIGIASEKFFSVQFEEAPKAEAAPAAPSKPEPVSTPMGMAMGAAPGMGASSGPATMGSDQVGMQTEEGIDQDKIDAQKVARKKKLWIGLAIWIFLVVGFIIVAQAFIGPKQDDTVETPYLTPVKIEEIILTEIDTSNMVPDIQKMEVHRREAVNFFRRSETEPSALYYAFYNFRLARFHNQGEQLDPKSESQLIQTQEQLVKQIQDQYRDAMRAYRTQLDKDARERFMTLRKMYPDENSDINKAATTHINIINKRNSKNKDLVP